MKKLLILLLVMLIPLSTFAEKRALKFEDMFKAGRLGSLSLSPDGSNAIFQVKIPDLEKNNYKTDIYITDLMTGKIKKLTNSEGNNMAPEFRSENEISFISTRDGDPQLYIMDLINGKENKVSDVPGGVGSYYWIPGSNGFVFQKDIFPCKKSIEDSIKKEKKIEDSGIDVKVLNSLMYRVWNSWKEGKRSHIFLADNKGKSGKDLTPGNYDTPPLDLGGNQDFVFSPDGNLFVFVKNTDKMVAISTNNDIFVRELDSGEEKNISKENRGSDVNPVFSPNGKNIAYISMKREGFEADKHNIILYDLKTRKRNNLTSGFKYSVNEFIFSPRGSYIYFTASESAFVPVYRVRLKDKKIEKISGNIFASGLNISGNGKYLVFLNQSVSSPKDIFKIKIRGKKISRVTDFNKDIFEGVEMNPVERFVFAGAGDDQVEGLLIKPPFFDPEKKYPMVFLIHGGPQGAWGDDFHYRWNMSLFASPGYVVAAINFHGSRGYGQEFTDAVSKDWGGAPFVDLVKGQKYLVENYKFIDKDKIVAAGASYGGYMINWIAGNYDHFKYPFKCLVSHDGIFDSRSMYYSTEELWFEEWEHGGTPWNSDLYEKFNPARFVEKFKIPMLIVHSEKDYRVPVSQGLMLFTAYQRRGIKSKMLYFPNEDHFVQKPKNAGFWWRSVFKWFEENIK